MTAIKLDAVLIGKAVPYGPAGEPSALRKTPVTGALIVTSFGLAGDEQGDRIHHGGLDKALHQYPAEHYEAWVQDHPALATPLQEGPGCFGENLSTRGMTEADVCIGDVLSLGTAVVQVSHGRQPCWKLNVRMGWKGMAAAVQKSGRTGWYYRVLQSGKVQAGDGIRLIERPHPDFPLTRLITALYVNQLDFEELQAIADLDLLAQDWRDLARKRLQTRIVES